MKLVSPVLSHKTEAGAVALNARGADEATGAFRSAVAEAMTFAAGHGIEAVIEGALICPMQPAFAYEDRVIAVDVRGVLRDI